VVAIGLLGMVSCDSSDPTAPADSTITVSANPQTVVVPSGSTGTTEITATLRSKNGTRLPDQEITFSTSAGTLTPPAETPVLTDSDGQANSTLTTSTSATITAQSGGISGTTQVQTASCDLAQFLLDVQPQELTTCSDTLTFTAQVEDTGGSPCANVRVLFIQDPANKIPGSFSPSSQISSDAMGLATVTWRPSSTQCDAKCTAAGDPNGGGDCGIFSFTATDTTGTFESGPVTVTESIP